MQHPWNKFHNIFIPCKKKHIGSHSSSLTSAIHPATSTHSSVFFVLLCILDFCKWNYTVCDLLNLASLKLLVYKVHLCGNMCQHFIPLWGRIVLHSVDLPQFVCPPITWWSLHFLVVMNRVALNACVHTFAWACFLFSYLLWIPVTYQIHDLQIFPLILWIVFSLFWG